MILDLTDPIYSDPDKAREHLEGVCWPNGPVCPHCGGREAITKLQGKAHRAGLYRCNGCGKQFTVTVGTVYERSHIPLHKWVVAAHLLCASKKGISTHQLHRMLDLPYKTAWCMAHRIRESMREPNPEGLGGADKTVEADETFIGRKKGMEVRRGVTHKHAVLGLVERGGKVRSVRLDGLTKAEVGRLVRENIDRESRLMTDEGRHYHEVGREFAEHARVEHGAGVYVDRDDPSVHTQTVEGFFSIFKRGMRGIHQHCGEAHLHRYLAEFDFRYNNRVALGTDDFKRANCALAGIVGKRLTYR